MSGIAVYRGSELYPSPSPGPVVTIGNFDGVHRGHQALLARVRARAAAAGRPSCAYTFFPAPVDILRPDQRRPSILSLDERIAAIAAQGIDQVVVEAFDLAFSERPSRWFAEEVLTRRLGASAIVVGWDFRFGHGREAGAEELAKLVSVDVEQLDPVLVDGEIVSSSRIRRAVSEGDVALAARLLGRPHEVVGTVVHGDHRGRTIGFPTANVDAVTELLPADGVYAARVEVDGARRDAVVNLGVRPTFGGGRRLLEAHLLGFSGDLYGRRVAVAFVDRVRGERKFASKDELVAQIRLDAEAAARILAAP